MQQYNQQELWKLFDILPAQLKDAILSEDTAEKIRKICERHKIEEEDMSEMAGMIGNVLMGLLSPENFFVALQIELGIEKEKAQSIFQEVNSFVFFPVKVFLMEFYPEIKSSLSNKIAEKTIEGEEEREAIKSEQAASIEKGKETEKLQQDVYREPIK